MKAVLLNSGLGKRMGALTANTPKCLVEVKEGETILSRQVSSLINCGVTDLVITTGPFAEQIEHYMARYFPQLEVGYVANPDYDSTNYIYSLLLAEKLLDDDILLLHGDLVFDEALVADLLASSEQNAVLVNPEAELPEKDFKGRITDNKIQEISINIFGDDCAFLIPLYKLSAAFMQAWLTQMKKFQEQDKLTVYAEEALNELLPELSLRPFYFTEEFCSEIDNLEDLEQVRQALSAKS